MNIHEHQAKEILKKYGAVVPEGVYALNVNELIDYINHMNDLPAEAEESLEAKLKKQKEKESTDFGDLLERYKKSIFRVFNSIVVGTVSNIIGFFTKEYSSNIFVFKKSKTNI